MKRILHKTALALAILLVAAGFAVAEGGAESSAAAEPLNIRLFSVRGYPGENTEIPGMIEDLISEKVGYPVTFDLLGGGPDSTLHPEVDMLLAANELPDVFQRFNIDPDFLEQAASKFTVQEYRENMPRQVKRLVEIMNQLGKDEQETWSIYQDANDGMMWGAARIWEWGWIPSGQMWRKDILDELGYDIPTTLAEAEEVFFNDPVLIVEDARHSQAEPRYHALGKTNLGRSLHVTFTLRAEATLIRVISARDMHRKERARYEQET